MSLVFAVQQPTGRDRETGAIKPTMDLTPATEFGELRFILRDFHHPFRDPSGTAAEVRRVLEEEQFGADDWLLLVGNPSLIGLVAAQTAIFTRGRLRLLQWDRPRHRYRPLEAQLGGLDPIPGRA
jgi:hypothetical protein